MALLFLLTGPFECVHCLRNEETAELSSPTLFIYRVGNGGPRHMTCPGLQKKLVRAQKDLGKGSQAQLGA